MEVGVAVVVEADRAEVADAVPVDMTSLVALVEEAPDDCPKVKSRKPFVTEARKTRTTTRLSRTARVIFRLWDERRYELAFHISITVEGHARGLQTYTIRFLVHCSLNLSIERLMVSVIGVGGRGDLRGSGSFWLDRTDVFDTHQLVFVKA